MLSLRLLAGTALLAALFCVSDNANAQYRRPTNPYSGPAEELKATRYRLERDGERIKATQERAKRMVDELTADIRRWKSDVDANKRVGETYYTYRNGVHRRVHERWKREQERLERERKLLKLRSERVQAAIRGIQADAERWQADARRYNERLQSLRQPTQTERLGGAARLTFDDFAPKRK